MDTGKLLYSRCTPFLGRPLGAFFGTHIRSRRIDTIITTGPPHSLHLIGQELKSRKGLHWIADFRDPWTSIGYHKKLKLGARAKRIHATLEQKVLDGADRVIVTSYATGNEFKGKTKTPIHLITNGYDAERIPDNRPLDDEFTVSHIGSLLAGRSPKLLWKVLADLVADLPHFKNDLKLQFAGVVSAELKQHLKTYKLTKYAEFHGYVDHDKAMGLQASSQVLLLLEIDSKETKGIIPGKLFEYLAVRRPILGIGPKAWDVVRILKETGAGEAYTHQAEVELKEVLLSYYKRYRNSELGVEPKG